MAEYGLPQRSAQTDANAGVVNPPAKQYTARQIAVPQEKQRVNTDLSTGLDNLASGLGQALQSRMDEETASINEQRKVRAAARQGRSAAINKTDQANKRTGWTRGIFGQNVEYREAQQRAAQNAVHAEYLKQATEIDQYAGESPEDYEERLATRLEAIVEPYGDDKETKALVTGLWLRSSEKLADKQYQSHYAYNQQQQRATVDTQNMQIFDTWTVEASQTASPEEAKQLLQDAKQFFTGVTKPPAMATEAWRDSVNKQLETSLRKGNVGAYNAAKDAGWIDKLGAKERVAMDRAITAYDVDFNDNVSTSLETSELAAIEAGDLEQATVVYQDATTAIDQLETRSSNTPEAKRIIAAARKKLARIYKSAFDSAKKNSVKVNKLNDLKEATRIRNIKDRSERLADIPHTKKEYEEALDLSIIEDIGRVSSTEGTPTKSEALKTLLENPEVARVVGSRLVDQETESPFIKTAVSSFIHGFASMANENGVLNDEGNIALSSISQLERNQHQFRNMVGPDTYDKYLMVKRGLSLKQTVERITKDVDNYTANKGKRDIHATRWPLPEGITKREFIAGKIQSWIDQYPNAESLSYYMEEFDRGLMVNANDFRAAEDYLKTSVQSAGINYRGIAIPDGQSLNNLTKYNFRELMDKAQSATGESASLLTPYLGALGYNLRDKDNKILTDINQIKGVTMYTIPGTGGVYIDSQEAQQPVHIPESTLRNWERVIDQRRNFKQLEEEAAGKTYDAWYEEQLQLRKANPFIFR